MLKDWRVVFVVFSFCILGWSLSSINGDTDPNDGQFLAPYPFPFCSSELKSSFFYSTSLLAASGFCLFYLFYAS